MNKQIHQLFWIKINTYVFFENPLKMRILWFKPLFRFLFAKIHRWTNALLKIQPEVAFIEPGNPVVHKYLPYYAILIKTSRLLKTILLVSPNQCTRFSQKWCSFPASTCNAIYRNSDKVHEFCSVLPFQQAPADVCTSNKSRVPAGFVKTVACTPPVLNLPSTQGYYWDRALTVVLQSLSTDKRWKGTHGVLNCRMYGNLFGSSQRVGLITDWDLNLYQSALTSIHVWVIKEKFVILHISLNGE